MYPRLVMTILLYGLLSVEASGYQGVTGATGVLQPYDEAKLAMVASQFPVSEAPTRVAYQRKIKALLETDRPVLTLPNLSDPNAELAQRLLLLDERLKPSMFEQKSGLPLRSEVMSVKPALPGDRVGTNDSCWVGGCYRIDLYNFFYNATVTALVDTTNKKVVSINSVVESQPELSVRLTELAKDIARYEPAVQLEVKRYLTFIGQDDKANTIVPVMINTKSALNDTLCERSKHLCVAPTYVLGDRALWVIVDLTDMKVAGLRWTRVGNSGPPTIVTERKLENEYVFKNFCEQVNRVERDGWAFDYHITTSDGLRLAKASFEDKPVFKSAKVVDWHVSYSRKDAFGYSDATGCPMFSSAVVVAFDGPVIAPLLENEKEVGFSISQDFRQQTWPAPCNYRYEEKYEFYRDGRFRSSMINHGRGCGNNATYRPILRINWGHALSDERYVVQSWSGGWQDVTQESWSSQDDFSSLSKNRFSHRVLDQSGRSYLMAPSLKGQNNGQGRGDSAFIYFTVNHPERDEGERDLVTLGACCNTGHRQGPEQFMQPTESLANQETVMWYVPQLQNDGRPGNEYCWAENQVQSGVMVTKTWPCRGGPTFLPATQVNGAVSDQ